MGTFVSLGQHVQQFPTTEAELPLRKTTSADEVQSALGDRIRALRSQYGWSQEQFAEICGLHRTYMGHVERGEKNVSLSTILRISEALGIPLPEPFMPRNGRSPRPRKPRLNNSNGLRDPRLGLVEIRNVLNELRTERNSLEAAIRHTWCVSAKSWGIAPGSRLGLTW